MEESIGSEKFTFGEVNDTQYVEYEIVDTELKLPYNPFIFDINLIVHRSRPNYEETGTQFALSREKKTVFCRKKKNQKEWNDNTAILKYLNAEIISERHFSIDERGMLRDEGSKHGTYFWVDRSRPFKIETGDIFLIAKQPMRINRVNHLPKPTIQLTYNGSNIKITEQKKLYLIGSHQKCDLVIASLYHFEVCINLTNFNIFTHLNEEQACSEHGLWYKLRSDRPGVRLEHGSLILVDPYIFRVAS